jgi:hypothetical protein
MKSLRFNIFIFFILFSNGFVSSQNDFTNIDTSYLTPKWMKKPLAVSNYRNGKPVNNCEDLYKFFLNNKPQYFIKKIKDEDVYFYNQRTLLAFEDTLAPKGFKIASKQDYLNMLQSKSSLLEKFEMNGWIDQGYYKDGKFNYFWTSDFELDGEIGIVLKVLNNAKRTYEFSSIPSDYGCQVYCIENLDEIIKDSIFEYKKLLPNDYVKLSKLLLDEVQSFFNSEEDFIVSVSGNLNCSKEGLMSNTLSKEPEIIFRKLNNTSINDFDIKLSESLKNFNVIPYYKGNILMANSDFKFDFKRTNSVSVISVFKQNELESSTITESLLSQAESRGFDYYSHVEYLEVNDFFSPLIRNRTTQFEKFKAPGISNSFLSFLPGLGLKNMTRNVDDKTTSDEENRFYNWSRLGTSFLISSLTLGAISISSKIYSKYYYNRYTNDLFGNNAEKNYKNANISQKIFLSSLIGYGVLSALDFTITFGIGAKNKCVQKELNTKLKSGKKIILY